MLSLADAILVVDDDADSRELLVAYLQAKGFTVHASPNGGKALSVAHAVRPRVILMDLTIPNVAGLDTTRRLRTHAGLRDATIIAVTARAFATDREAAHRAGCNFFIPKPYDLTTLGNVVDGLLRSSAARSAFSSMSWRRCARPSRRGRFG